MSIWNHYQTSPEVDDWRSVVKLQSEALSQHGSNSKSTINQKWKYEFKINIRETPGNHVLKR